MSHLNPRSAGVQFAVRQTPLCIDPECGICCIAVCTAAATVSFCDLEGECCDLDIKSTASDKTAPISTLTSLNSADDGECQRAFASSASNGTARCVCLCTLPACACMSTLINYTALVLLYNARQ
jgi:hypothetical protein